MGELSKRIGDEGEDYVINFLNLIGWRDIEKNFDIPSTNPQKHAVFEDSGLRNTHGIDGLFSYRSPLISNILEFILYSSKYSTKKYPNSPAKTFKEFY